MFYVRIGAKPGQVRVLGQGMGPLVGDLAEELDADEAEAPERMAAGGVARA